MAESEIFITKQILQFCPTFSLGKLKKIDTKNVLEGEMNITALRAQSQPTHRSENYFYNSRFVIH
jgi:hypothetical protein